MNNWEVIDNNGTVHSGTEEEMRTAFDVMQGMVGNYSGLKSIQKALIDQWDCEWEGDLKLVEVHAITR